MKRQHSGEQGRLGSWWAQVSSSAIMAVALVVLALSALVSSVGWLVSQRIWGDQVQELRTEIDCRAELSRHIQVLESERSSAFSAGLIALARDDSAGVAKASADAERVNDRLVDARDALGHAAQVCQGQ